MGEKNSEDLCLDFAEATQCDFCTHTVQHVPANASQIGKSHSTGGKVTASHVLLGPYAIISVLVRHLRFPLPRRPKHEPFVAIVMCVV